jgi:hypothetical protein
MRRPQHVAGFPARRIELFHRHHVLVGGHLEDAVRRGVDDPRTSAPVLLAQFVEDRGARGGPVSDDRAAGATGEFRQ